MQCKGLNKASEPASSVTEATVKVNDATALMDKKFVTEHRNSASMTDTAGK